MSERSTAIEPQSGGATLDLRQSLYGPATRVLPAAFFEKRQARQADADIRSSGVVFIHIPRAAGVSVMRTIYRSAGIRHFTVDQFLEVAAPDLRDLPRFAIVRNPWDRAVSAYHFARQGGVAGGAQMAHLDRYRGPAFATFEAFVIQYLSTKNVWKADGVFRPQSYYLGNHAETTLDHIGVFGQLHETESWLSGELGRPIQLAHCNSTSREHPYQKYYSDTTREIVADIYRADIERFDFAF